MVVRLHTADADMFEDVGTKLKSNGAIHVNLSDGEWTFGSVLHLGRLEGYDESFITNLPVVVVASAVLLFIVVGGNNEASLVDLLPINNDRNIEQHVAIENQQTRGHSHGLVDGSLDCMLGSYKGSVNNFECSLNIIRNVGRLVGSDHVANSFMATFNDCIGLGVLHSDRDSLDTIAVQGQLEWSTDEGTSSVIKASCWTRVASVSLKVCWCRSGPSFNFATIVLLVAGRSGSKWASDLSQQLILVGHQMWMHRNLVFHSDDNFASLWCCQVLDNKSVHEQFCLGSCGLCSIHRCLLANVLAYLNVDKEDWLCILSEGCSRVQHPLQSERQLMWRFMHSS